METLAEALPKEQARVRELLVAYKSIGTAGIFGATMIEQILQKSDIAIMSGEVTEMIKAYQELKSCE